MSESAAYQLPPVSKERVDLAIADLAISAALLPLSVWIAWKHGKLGTVCWPIFISYFITRFIDDIYLIIERNKPLIPGALNITMQAAGICCLLLGIIGVLYEAYVPPTPRTTPAGIHHCLHSLLSCRFMLLNSPAPSR